MAGEGASEGRGATDVVALLIELGRALKACRFFGVEHPARKSALDRSFHAFSAGLERSGELNLEVGGGAIRQAGRPHLLGPGSVDVLARDLEAQGVGGLRLAAGMTREAFGALLASLAMDPDELAQAGGIERVLAGCAQSGVLINPGATAPPAAPRQQTTPAQAAEVAPPSAPEPLEPLADTASFADLAEEETDAGDTLHALWPSDPAKHDEEDPDADLPAPKPQTTGIDPLRTLHRHLEEVGDESSDGALFPESSGDRGAELVKGLRALDECREDADYEESLQRVTREAAALADEGPSDDTYRAVLVLSSHASESPRSERQRALAEEALFGLAAGARLDDVVQRACETGPQASVRATQILLQLGAHAVPRIFDALVNASDPEHRGQLNALLIAMGEKALPEVKASLEAAHPERARLAARLSGEMQNPACIPYLAALVKDVATPIELAREVAKALVRIGTPSAVAVLQEAVASPRPDLAGAAAYCLGASQAPRALETLAGALRRALREDQDELARETLRGLGALGRSEAVPVLEEVLSKGGLLARRRLRELKLGAVSALARIRGDEARAALERASAKGDPPVRHAASTALTRSGNR
jgi:hypothetical protein